MKDVLTVSRKWNNPKIRTRIDHEGIDVSIELQDFLAALVQELGPVTWVFTDRTFQVKFDAAVARVLSGIKEETVKVV